jgi:hypothetical protein
MLTLRCTQKLLTRMRATPEPSPPEPQSVLGDWYATLVVTRPRHLVLCVSERTFLPVVLPASPTWQITELLPVAIVEILNELRLPADWVQQEWRLMDEVVVAKTRNRSAVAAVRCMAESIRLAARRRHHRSLLDTALWLAETPWKTFNYLNAPEMTRALLVGVSGPEN